MNVIFHVLLVAFVIFTNSCLCYPTTVYSEDVPKQGFDQLNNEDNSKAVISLQQEIGELKNDISKLRDIVNGIQNTDAKNEGSVSKHVRHRRESKRRHRSIKDVAFQAVLMYSPAEVKIGDVIIFDHVITNDAHAYNVKDGIFTAPVSGTYFFSTTIVAEENNYIEASIFLNDQPQVTAVSDHWAKDKSWDQGAASAVFNLYKGDQVKVSILWPNSNHKVTPHGKSSFCGYLLSRSHHR